MNMTINACALAVLTAVGGGAAAADQGPAAGLGRETRPVDARVQRVKLDGLVELRLRQGSPAALVISGEARQLARVTTRQQGDTLVIDVEDGEGLFNTRGLARAELTLPQLREVVSDSLGATEITGFSGDRLEVSLEGAGPMKVAASYRILRANLEGLGSMTIQGGASDTIELNLMGAGFVNLSGQAKWLRANLGGLGGLDAQQFQAENVAIELGGLGNATVFARQSAALSLSGLGSVTVYGKPVTRNVSVDGLGKVSWR
ncbi:MAG: GIN domain-containing protein [Gammaproteobacteria bacterium]